MVDLPGSRQRWQGIESLAHAQMIVPVPRNRLVRGRIDRAIDLSVPRVRILPTPAQAPLPTLAQAPLQ